MKASQKELKTVTEMQQAVEDAREAVEEAENKAVETGQVVEEAVRNE